jgi:hypothetical protein
VRYVVGRVLNNRHCGADGDAQCSTAGKAGEHQGRGTEIVPLKLHLVDLRRPFTVGQEDKAAGGQGSSLLFTMVPGGWYFGHGSP